LQCPNQLISGAFLPDNFDKFHGHDITNNRHHVIHDEFGKTKIGKIPVWVVVPCLEQCSNKSKQYQIQCQTFFQY